jgi:hypothetical protein
MLEATPLGHSCKHSTVFTEDTLRGQQLTNSPSLSLYLGILRNNGNEPCELSENEYK